MDELFNVVIFFPGDSSDYDRERVLPEEAVRRFFEIIRSPAARIAERVIITDQGDCTNMVWERGKGITYPPDFKEMSL